MCTEAEDRLHCACFTGHRPEKLRQTEQEVCIRLEREIQSAVENGFHTFITGMARGVDLWASAAPGAGLRRQAGLRQFLRGV